MPITKVQAVHGNTNGVTVPSFSVTFPGNVTAGNLLILTSGNGFTSITDTQNNLWAAPPLGVSSTTNFGAGSLILIAWAVASASGPLTVTIHNTNVNDVYDLIAIEYNANPAAIDQSQPGASGKGTGKAPAPLVTGVPNALVVAAAIGTVKGGQGSVWSVDSGFTIDDTMDDVAGFNAGFAVASLNVPVSGTSENPTFTNPAWIFGIDVTMASFFGSKPPVTGVAIVNVQTLNPVKLPWPEGTPRHSEGKHYKI